MQMSPLIAVHMSAALGALVLGPVAIWARKGAVLRPRVHRAFGYGFFTLMLGASISGMFIRDYQLPNGYWSTLILAKPQESGGPLSLYEPGEKFAAAG